MPLPRPEVRIESRDLPAADMRILELRGTERISRPFSYEATLTTIERAGPSARELIGSSITLVFEENGEEIRRVSGMIARAVDRLDTQYDRSVYRVQIVPHLFRLTLVRTQDVYVGLSVPEIVMKKLALAGLDRHAQFHLHPGAEKRYPKREFVIQYQESDLDFVSRLLEHVGISYCFTHGEHGDTIVFTDHNRGFPLAEGEGKAHFESRGDEVGVYRLEVAAEVIPALYAVSDYNYEKPLVDLSAIFELKEGFGGGIIEFGSNVKEPAESAVLARVRAEEHLSRSLVFEGESRMHALTAGRRIRLEGHSLVTEGDLLVTEVEHRYRRNSGPDDGKGSADPNAPAEPTYANTFKAIPLDAPYRPARITPRPRIYGVMSGIVEAEPGAEQAERPWIDQHGRYIVRVMFDTAEPNERTRASLPIRMAQAHSGSDYGIHFPLRPGTEVLLVFTGGDPDRPIIVASAPNALTPSPVVDRIATYHRIRTASGVQIEIDDGR